MSDTSSPGPAALLADLALRRDPATWACLLAVAGETIRRSCARILGMGPAVDDAVQETLLHLRDDAGRFRVPGEGDPDGAALAWIRAVSANTALQILRSERRLQCRQQGYGMSIAPQTQPEGSESALIDREQVELLRSAIAELPAGMRIAVVMHHLEELPFADIGAAMRCPESTARSLAHRGIRRLRDRLTRVKGHVAPPTLGAAFAAMQAGENAGSAGLSAAAGLLERGRPLRTQGLEATLQSSGPALAWLAVAAVLLVVAGWLLAIAVSSPPRAPPQATGPAAAGPTPPGLAGGPSATVLTEIPGADLAGPAQPDAAGPNAGVPYSIKDPDEADPAAPAYIEPGWMMSLPLFARVHPGDLAITGELTDHAGLLHARLLRRAGRLHCCAWGAEQQPVFDGAVETAEQRRSLPPQLMERLFTATGEVVRELIVESAAERAERAALMEARFTKQAGALHLLVRQGPKAQVLFDGAVATPDQRAAIPHHLSSLIGADVWRTVDTGPMPDSAVFIGSDALGDEPPAPFSPQ